MGSLGSMGPTAAFLFRKFFHVRAVRSGTMGRRSLMKPVVVPCVAKLGLYPPPLFHVVINSHSGVVNRP